MGLDMYLTKKTYVQVWEHHKPEERFEVVVKKGGVTYPNIKPEKVKYVEEEVMYWRKFNALHGWFVNECGDGKDECQEMYVSEDKLKEILNLLKQVKMILDNSKIVTKVLTDWNNEEYEVSVYDCDKELFDLFPPTEGFFFGSTEIVESFKEDVERSITIFEESVNDNSGDYYYQASW